MERSTELDPVALPPGTDVGGWRLEGWKGRGTYGTVYRAVGLGPDGTLAALKLAQHPWDERFDREGRMLSRIRHPNVPSLLGHGMWKHPDRPSAYPYLVMEWIDGLPLYEWATERNPTSRQVLRMLAQVARALEATHAVGGVHRDVKGDNILVRPVDGQVFLTDFGSGNYAGAAPLTWQLLPPGTPNYRSPEAWRFALQHVRHPNAFYVAQHTDDLFALGMTAYRLVTDEYPPSTDPEEEEARCWREGGEGAPPPRVINPRVIPQLSAIIQRMLEVRPEERGTARELAEALEQAASQAGAEADVPLFLAETQDRSEWPTDEALVAEVLGHRPLFRNLDAVRRREQQDAAVRAEAFSRSITSSERSASHASAVGWGLLLFLMVGLCWSLRWEPLERPAVAQEETRDAGSEDGGTVGMGSTALSSAAPLEMPLSSVAGIGLDMPKQPFRGQQKPPCKKPDVEIHGGCWVRIADESPPCGDRTYEWKGGCYYPVGAPIRPSTSEEP